MKDFTRVPNNLIQRSDLTPSEFRILVLLMSLNPCYPSYGDLSNRTGLSRRTVMTTLKSLKVKGLIIWKKGTNGKNNQYIVRELAFRGRAKNAP